KPIAPRIDSTRPRIVCRVASSARHSGVVPSPAAGLSPQNRCDLTPAWSRWAFEYDELGFDGGLIRVVHQAVVKAVQVGESSLINIGKNAGNPVRPPGIRHPRTIGAI